MIYKQLEPEMGEIFVDGARHNFKIIRMRRDGWADIQLMYYKTSPMVSVHSVISIPTHAKLNRPFRTSGHQLKVTKQAKII